MDKEKQKKILKFMKSNLFCNSFLIFCSLIGTTISLKDGVNTLNLWGFPIAFTIGINGLIFIPMACDKKLSKLEKSIVNDIKEEENKINDIKIDTIKKTNNNDEKVINIINNILLVNSSIGVKIELLSEWQEYLKNTLITENGIKLVQELIYYLILINNLSIEKVIPLTKNKENILDLLIHFSNNGYNLAKALNRKVTDIKRERII